LLILAIPCQSLSRAGQWFGRSIHLRWMIFPKIFSEKQLRLTMWQRVLHIFKLLCGIGFWRVRCGFMCPVQGLYQASNTRLLLETRRVDLFSGAGGLSKEFLKSSFSGRLAGGRSNV
jgi:hypothetical protein